MRNVLLIVLCVALISSFSCNSGNNGPSEQPGDGDGLTDGDEVPDGDAILDGDDEPDGDGQTAFDPYAIAPRTCAEDAEALEAVLEAMDRRTRIGQHIMLTLDRANNRISPATLARMETYKIGAGFIRPMMGLPTGRPDLAAAFIRDAQTQAMRISGAPLLLSTDQEGGVYSALSSLTGGSDPLAPLALGATRDPEAVFTQFDIIGRELRSLGLTMTFSPLLDTMTATENGNLNTRTFGPDVALNAELGMAAVAGLRANGIMAVVKHFPGDGMTPGNTHHVHVRNTATREELEAAVLPPFRAAFSLGADGVMTIPAQYTAFDDTRCAITSRAITTDFLRGEIGYEGLIVTDDLNMAGARIGLSDHEIPGLEALKAGADLLLYVEIGDEELGELVDRIEAALDTGELDPEAFEDSTRRILRMKQRYCLFDENEWPEPEAANFGEALARPGDALALRSIGHRAIVRRDNSPLPDLATSRILCVAPDRILDDPAAGWSWFLTRDFCSVLGARLPDVQVVTYYIPFDAPALLARLTPIMQQRDLVVLATFHAAFSDAQQQLAEALLAESGLPLVHVAQGVPFDARQTHDRAAAVLLLNGALPLLFESAVDVLLGDAQAGGADLYRILEP